MNPIIIAGFFFLLVPILFGLLYIFKRDLYGRTDKVLNDLIGGLLSKVFAAIALLMFIGSFVIIGIQLYFCLIQSKCAEMPMAVLLKDEILSQILSFTEWFYTSSYLETTVHYVLEAIPLSVFLMFTSILIALVVFPVEEEHAHKIPEEYKELMKIE